MVREEELLRKIEAGDMSGLDALVALYYPGILRYCLWHTQNRQTAEDAAQDTFLKTIRHLDRYVHRGKFKAYIYRIAANVCIDMGRKKGTEQLPEDLPQSESGFEQIEADTDLIRMLHRLPEEQREAVLLRFVHELKVREIAQVTGVPMRTVQSRLRSALRLLEKELWEGGRADG